jgi:glycerophosphoryl diester phosphodiesterase
MPAFKNARRHGATAVETDVWPTSDDQLVLMHDSTLDRTTNCTGPVAQQTLAYIRQDCFGYRNGERIPTLDQLVHWGSTYGVNLILELKNGNWGDANLARFDEIVDKYGMSRRVLVLSRYAAALKAVAVDAPDLRTEFIVSSWAQVADARTWADGLNVYSSQLTRARVAGLHRDGVRVLGRVTDRKRAWKHLKRVGADGLLTNWVAAYQIWNTRWLRTH